MATGFFIVVNAGRVMMVFEEDSLECGVIFCSEVLSRCCGHDTCSNSLCVSPTTPSRCRGLLLSATFTLLDTTLHRHQGIVRP